MTCWTNNWYTKQTNMNKHTQTQKNMNKHLKKKTGTMGKT